MIFFVYLKNIYKICKRVYRNIGYTNKEFVHRFFIFYYDKFIYPRQKSFEFNDNVLLFILPKRYGNKFQDSTTGINQIINPLRQFLKERRSDVEINLWFYDENKKVYDILKFLKQIHISGPKKIIIDSPQYKSAKFRDFGTKIYHYIQERYKVCMIEIGWDTVSEKWWRDIYSSDLDRIVLILDNPQKKFVPKLLSDNNKALVMVHPFNLGQISQVTNHRNIDYNFVGLVSSYRNYRNDYLNYIDGLGYNSLLAGSNLRKEQIAYKNYLEILNKSKISINFSMTHSQNFQLKGRVWEIMLAGSMLLEQDNEQIKFFFKEGTHFVSFSDKFELKNKLLHYINDDSKRIRIAEAGQKRAIELIGSNDFFKFITNLT
jgi:hypothetical protein